MREQPQQAWQARAYPFLERVHGGPLLGTASLTSHRFDGVKPLREGSGRQEERGWGSGSRSRKSAPDKIAQVMFKDVTLIMPDGHLMPLETFKRYLKKGLDRKNHIEVA
jgi:hypothetical protein